MDENRLEELMRGVADGSVAPQAAVERLRHLPFEDLGFARVDHHRVLRKGLPEAIFCEGKTTEQVVAIVTKQREHGSNVLATRCAPETAHAVLAAHPGAVHHEAARIVTLTINPPAQTPGYVAVVCAGTSDIPVAEEAAITCESSGSRVERIYDAGVAGIHRLMASRDRLTQADAVVVCAGMEGALPSVVAGLVRVPVIAVPTSVGYGASFHGLAALLAMLNSCAVGVSVVNIDNGFGAGAIATMVNRGPRRSAEPEDAAS